MSSFRSAIKQKKCASNNTLTCSFKCKEKTDMFNLIVELLYFSIIGLLGGLQQARTRKGSIFGHAHQFRGGYKV